MCGREGKICKRKIDLLLNISEHVIKIPKLCLSKQHVPHAMFWLNIILNMIIMMIIMTLIIMMIIITVIIMMIIVRCQVPARTIANALRDICKKILIERSLAQVKTFQID